MSLNKKAITTIVICGLAYILLAVLVVLGYSGRLNASCISICVMTNAITAIFFQEKRALCLWQYFPSLQTRFS